MFPFIITTKAKLCSAKSEQRETRDQTEQVLLSFIRAMVLRKPLIKYLNRILINLGNSYELIPNCKKYEPLWQARLFIYETRRH